MAFAFRKHCIYGDATLSITTITLTTLSILSKLQFSPLYLTYTDNHLLHLRLINNFLKFVKSKEQTRGSFCYTFNFSCWATSAPLLFYCYAECHYARCRYTERRGAAFMIEAKGEREGKKSSKNLSDRKQTKILTLKSHPLFQLLLRLLPVTMKLITYEIKWRHVNVTCLFRKTQGPYFRL
jgi:hypothetical protein